MKKTLVLMLCTLSICVMLAIPAMAAESYDFTFWQTDTAGVDYIEPGTYDVSVDFMGDEFPDFTQRVEMTDTPAGKCVVLDFTMPNGYTFKASYCNELDNYVLIVEFECDGMYFADMDAVEFSFKRVEQEPVDVPGASIWDVFTGAGNYIAESVNSATALFYNAEAATLTPVGVLSLVAIAIGLAILIVVLLRNFLPLC